MQASERTQTRLPQKETGKNDGACLTVTRPNAMPARTQHAICRFHVDAAVKKTHGCSGKFIAVKMVFVACFCMNRCFA
jgi:hypothetical protein